MPIPPTSAVGSSIAREAAGPIAAKLSRGSKDAPPLCERSGTFEIRLAASRKELKQVQRLRYRVFYEEGRAIAGAEQERSRLDLCPFDAICDHLLVVDTDVRSTSSGRVEPQVVGTYRLLRRDVAEAHCGFYSQSEFDLAPLLHRHRSVRFLELGRSCVHPDYRAKRVIALLWRGLWLYSRQHRIDALIGCASLPGTNGEALHAPLRFLLSHAAAEPVWQVEAWPHCRAVFERTPTDVDPARALAALPPLIKAYLRAGARFSRTAVLDHQFGTTDVFAVMPMSDIDERYLSYYGAPSCLPGTSAA